MNEKVRNHVIGYAKKNGWETDDDSLIEIIREGKEVWEGDEDERRHWIEYTRVVEVDGMFISFASAKGAGDIGVYDAGWEFDPATITEVVPQKIETTVYVAVK